MRVLVRFFLSPVAAVFLPASFFSAGAFWAGAFAAAGFFSAAPFGGILILIGVNGLKVEKVRLDRFDGSREHERCYGW